MTRKELKTWAAGENKTGCAAACVYFFNALENVRYLHKISDIVRAVRGAGWTVRSRMSSIKKDSTVGSVRPQLAKLGAGYYLIRVDGHALVMLHTGETVVDTDPRKRDRRKITHIYKVCK